MKKIAKTITGVLAVAALSFGIVALSCRFSRGSANVAFAQSTTQNPENQVSIPGDSLSVVQALQTTFRSISSSVLPAVVEVDVTTKTKSQSYNPFKDLPFFFGMPDDDEDEREYESSALGSGVIVRKTGNTVYVLTNNHVTENSTKIKIKLNDEREFTGTLVGSDERIDIALVSFKTDDNDITVAKLGDSDSVQQGDIVLALGSPLGYFASVTQGIVSATGRDGGGIGSISDFIQTDAAINQGNSGGPLVNIYGEIIGINTWIASSSGGSQGLGFSIPINNIKTAIDQFISDGKVSYGWLGVSLLDVDQDYKEELGIGKNTNGALVAEVFIDSPAMKGGMQAGDFIVALNGKAMKDSSQLVREVGSIQSGKTATITVQRGNNKIDLSVKMDERNNDIASDNGKLWPGFIASPLTDEIRKEMKIDDKIKGVVVSSLQAKTPAASLRLQKGDIITAVNDKKISSVQDFYEALNTVGKTEIWFDIYSDGHTVSTGRYKLQN
ncbi:MAG: Do family serine endopeptidase [Treponema sp.]|nr:Do family serine endopeptidase [Treponema sp.]